ncbi:MAG: hypothetical protein CM1200mP30_09310 [Pseudomonadota bacterium]|nr:MAG: hypothetical protein CM1200mP30_09310 [Pseudomonadota bacterium]
MATWIKEAITEEQRDEAQKQVRDTVEKLLEDIDKRGDRQSGNFQSDLTTGLLMNSGFLKKKSNPVLIDLMHKQLRIFALHRIRSGILLRYSGIP